MSDYVTVAAKGNVKADPTGHSRIPRWAEVEAAAKSGAGSKQASALIEKLDQLETLQRAVKLPNDVSVPGPKSPVVLVPEDGELTKGDYWSVPPQKQYLSDPGRLERLVLDCYEHLRCLNNPSGRTYLSAGMENRASWVSNVRRVYLAGHSGGGKPLSECAAADMMLIKPKSVMGVGGRAADLWLLDCTYGFKPPYLIDRYLDFCKNWNDNGKLAYRHDAARLVCVYRPRDKNSDTETGADNLRQKLAKLLGASEAALRILHDSTDMGSSKMLSHVIPALASSPVVFIRTHVSHSDIPSKRRERRAHHARNRRQGRRQSVFRTHAGRA